MKKKKRILVAPLDWGIGHATRCIPIIRELIRENFQVVIAADNRPLHVLIDEFPELETIRFPGYNISYSKSLPMNLNILLQIPKLFLKIKKEHTQLEEIIQSHKIDGIISDNRFGLFTKKIPCVFITHQLEIQAPYFKKEIQRNNYKYINKYDQCWVPDFKSEGLSGKLSRPDIMPKNIHYIGPLSRFKKINTEKKYAILTIISGPEPQRTLFEKKILKQLKDRDEKSIVVLGIPERKKEKRVGNVIIKNYASSKELNQLIAESELIISRSGYSTIMDLVKLEKRAIFIPTPGQTEQEYLAKYFLNKKICFSENQENFLLKEILEKSTGFRGFSKINKEYTNWKDLFSLF